MDVRMTLKPAIVPGHEFFVLEAINDAEQPIWPLANARRRKRSRPIGIGEPVGKRRHGLRRRSWAVPPEEASDKKTQVQQPLHDRRGCEESLVRGA